MNTNDKQINLSPTRMVNLKKLVPGALVLSFQDAAQGINERTVVIDAHREVHRIPLNLAASLFQIDGTYMLYKNGYFTFNTDEEKEAVFSYAKSLGIYYEDAYAAENDNGSKVNKFEQPEQLFSSTEMKNMLNLRRIKQITAVLESGNDAQISLLVDSAMEMKDKITIEIMHLIEDKTGVGFPEGDE